MTDQINTTPPADPSLLALANRMLADRIAGVAHALRGSGLPALCDIDDSEDLQQHVAALAGAYQMELLDRYNALSLIDVLKRNLASKEHECEALIRQADAANERAAEKPIVGYYVSEKITTDADTLNDAMLLAMRYTRERGSSHQAFEVRRVGIARRAAEWVPE